MPPAIVIPSKALVDNTIKKMSPAVVGVLILLLKQAAVAAGWPVDALIRALAAGALLVSLALLPLCLRLSSSYFEQIRQQIASRSLTLGERLGGGDGQQPALARLDLRDGRVLRLLAAYPPRDSSSAPCPPPQRPTLWSL